MTLPVSASSWWFQHFLIRICWFFYGLLSLTLLLRCCHYFLLHCCQLVVGSSPSTFSSRSCWFITFDTLVCWFIAFNTLISVVGSLPRQSRLGCWFIAFNNLGSRSTRSSLEHLGHLYSFICFKLDLYTIYKFQLEGECWIYYVWPMRPKSSIGPYTCT